MLWLQRCKFDCSFFEYNKCIYKRRYLEFMNIAIILLFVGFSDLNLSFVKFEPFDGNTVNCCQQPIAHCLTWMWIVKIFLYVQQLCNIFPLFLSVDYKSSTSSNIWWIIIMQCFVVGTNNVVTTADKPPNKNAYFICTNYLVRKTCYV